MVFDVRQETGDQPEAIKRVADELGVPPNMLWQWVERAARSESSDETPTADPDAYESGMQLVQFGALDEAQTLWGAAAEAGDTTAAFNLGVLLVQRGDLDEAANWWRTAADAGDPDAAAGLGMLLVQRGELDESETLWRTAGRRPRDLLELKPPIGSEWRLAAPGNRQSVPNRTHGAAGQARTGTSLITRGHRSAGCPVG